MSDYQKRIEDEIVRLGLDKRVGLTQCNVLHELHCPMAAHGNPGPCRCEPDIVFIDFETGRRITAPAAPG